jgi:adenine-specific DNA-methyltransferase
MYPRLILARNLLSDDGVIFISIDDNEVDNLNKILNEVFGEENNLDGFVWYYEGVNDNQDEIKNTHEYILAIAKNIKNFETNSSARDINVNLKDVIDNSIVKNGAANPVSSVLLPIGFPCELKEGTITHSSVSSLTYDRDLKIKNFKLQNEVLVSSGWSSKDILLEYIANKFEEVTDSKKQLTNFLIKKNGNIHYLKKRDQSYIISVLRNYGTTQNASKLLTDLGLKKYFSFPKPVNLIKYLFKIQKNYDGQIFMDFFSGSGTSAESIMELNIEDGGNRKFISIQLPEKTSTDSDAYLDGYQTITEIGKDRIRRAAKKITDKNLEKTKNLDLGFKVFKLDTSNIKGWDGNPDNLEESLFDTQDNIKTDRNEHDVLYEILLKYGLDLTLPIEEKQIAGKTVFSVGYGALFICLADNITNQVAEGIGEWKEQLQPEVCRVVFKDSGFTDVEKTNSVQTLKRFGINEVKSI